MRNTVFTSSLSAVACAVAATLVISAAPAAAVTTIPLHTPGAAVAPAAGAGTDLSSKREVVIKVEGKADGTKEMPGYTQLSSGMGSTNLQDWYNASPEWAQGILGVMFVAVALDAFGTIIGPVRSLVFNAIRDNNLPIPVPPRP